MGSSKKLLPNVFAVRFDFGVPLEDIFFADDLHPRLKLLFSKAFQSWLENDETVEYILQNEQGTLQDRLSLKEKLVLGMTFDWNYPSGTYLWVLRHFLGRLPIPLLPKYSNTIVFPWEQLAKECKEFLERYRSYGAKSCEILDKDVAEALCMTPFHHFLLLNVFIIFLKKLSIRKRSWMQRRGDKNSVLALVKYFYSAVFSRPYKPGYVAKRDPYQYFLIYLILRWKNITKHFVKIGHPAKLLQNNLVLNDNNRSYNFEDKTNENATKDRNYNITPEKYMETETLFHFLDNNKDEKFKNCKEEEERKYIERYVFNPDVVTVYKNVPLILERRRMYLKEMGCQTETELVSNKEQDFFETCIENQRLSNAESYKLSFWDTDTFPHETKKHNLDLSDTIFQSAADFSVDSLLHGENWEKIQKETIKTIKKVEGYIDDDYETFKREEYNQILKERPRSLSSFKSGQAIPKKLSKTDFHQSTPRSSPGPEENRDITYNSDDNKNISFICEESKNNLTFEINKDNEHNRTFDVAQDELNDTSDKKDTSNSNSEKDKEGNTSYEKYPDVFDEDPEILSVIHEHKYENDLSVIDEKPHPESFEEKCNYFENFVRNKFGYKEKNHSTESIVLKTPEASKKNKSFKNLFENNTKKSFKDFAKNIPLQDRLEDLDISSENDLHSPKKGLSKKKYVLKRIRMSLEFLRTLTPKKSDFNWLEKKVRYERVKCDKVAANRSNSI